jgi:hypothetical protein
MGSQENVSKLERGDTEGSEFTVQYAAACEVNPYWLATGEGNMIEIVAYDTLTKSVVRDMQLMKEEEKRYLVITADALVKNKKKPYSGPERREKNEMPNAERRLGEGNYQGAIDYQYDSADENESNRRKTQ